MVDCVIAGVADENKLVFKSESLILIDDRNTFKISPNTHRDESYSP